MSSTTQATRFDHRHLHIHGTSVVHRLSPEAKLVGLLAFVATVAVTPRRSVGAFAVDVVALAIVVLAARLPVRTLLLRLVAVVPFIAFAALLPFLGDGETTRVAGLELSIDGLWATGNIVAKALLGATAAIVVTATTPIADLLAGLGRLRLPKVVVGIIAFMFRYLDLVVDELARMRRAMAARAYNPRWLWQAGPIASSAGSLFVRTYERGERVHNAMLARGYTGTMPDLDHHQTNPTSWLLALCPALVAAGALAVTVMA